MESLVSEDGTPRSYQLKHADKSAFKQRAQHTTLFFFFLIKSADLENV